MRFWRRLNDPLDFHDLLDLDLDRNFHDPLDFDDLLDFNWDRDDPLGRFLRLGAAGQRHHRDHKSNNHQYRAFTQKSDHDDRSARGP